MLVDDDAKSILGRLDMPMGGSSYVHFYSENTRLLAIPWFESERGSMPGPKSLIGAEIYDTSSRTLSSPGRAFPTSPPSIDPIFQVKNAGSARIEHLLGLSYPQTPTDW